MCLCQTLTTPTTDDAVHVAWPVPDQTASLCPSPSFSNRQRRWVKRLGYLAECSCVVQCDLMKNCSMISSVPSACSACSLRSRRRQGLKWLAVMLLPTAEAQLSNKSCQIPEQYDGWIVLRLLLSNGRCRAEWLLISVSYSENYREGRLRLQQSACQRLSRSQQRNHLLDDGRGNESSSLANTVTRKQRTDKKYSECPIIKKHLRAHRWS